MAQTVRIPAWKRMGLKLQKFSQSKASSQVNCEKNTGDHEHSGDGLDTGIALPTEDTTTRLGKRKHQHEVAEVDHETSKKSKNIAAAPIEREASSADSQSGHSLEEKSIQVTNEPHAHISKPLQPKGDPNYRRKKKGAHGKQQEPHVAVERRSQTPSLSPSRADLATDGSTLLVSTETDFPLTVTTPSKQSTRSSKDKTDPSSSPPLRLDRRKSVTFTPDTKTVDGNSASNLFKKWAQEQKGPAAEFTEAEVAEFNPPPGVHPANDPLPASAKDKVSVKSAKKPKSKATALKEKETSDDITIPTVGAKKKDPSRYLSYLTQYHSDRPNWKFNKAKQNDILDNALNVFRIPEEYSAALYEYVKGLQGAGVIERLKQRCVATFEEIDTAEREATSAMDSAEVRKAAQEEALQERLTKERRRRRLEGDVENMLDHPYTEGYIRRLKRGRAEALLRTLNLAKLAPAPPTVASDATAHNLNQPPSRKTPKKSKLRTDVSSDETSDSSSSEESSEEDESSDESGPKSSSASNPTSDSESVSDEVGSDSDESSNGESESG